jgi:ribose-phosphate pyrophosphokinase
MDDAIRAVDGNKMLVFSGNAHPGLAEAICENLLIKLGNANVSRFRDGEINVEISESVRGKDVYVVQPTCGPDINGSIMELLIMLDALSRSSSERITAVIPYYGYARQDRKVSPRAPISARLLADLIEGAGAHRVLTLDLHAGQIQGFFKIPVDNLYATSDLCNVLESLDEISYGEKVVVSPDAGGVRRARYLAHIMKGDVGLAIIDKRRSRPGYVGSVNIIGDVEGKAAILVDDMIDSAGTICAAAEALKNAGVTKVLAAGTHAVFSPPAIERIQNSQIDRMFVTDTIPLGDDARKLKNLQVVSVAPILARAIANIHIGGSVSSLFTDVQVIN